MIQFPNITIVPGAGRGVIQRYSDCVAGFFHPNLPFHLIGQFSLRYRDCGGTLGHPKFRST